MILRFCFYLLLSLSILSCSTTPISNKKSFLLTSEKSENQMGEKAYKDILKKEKPTRNRALAKQIQKIGKRLAAVAGKPDYKWEFRTLESKQPNAFCLPGGKIAIYTGIVPYAKNEAGLAAIMGHEIGHALARHGGQRMSMGKLASIGLTAGALFGAYKSKGKSKKEQLKYSAMMAALGAGVTYGVMLPFSRSNESEADEIGLELMARAGYDPREAVLFWQRFAKLPGKKPPAWASTHPSSTKRAKDLQKMMPKALETYQRARQKYGRGPKMNL